MNPMSNVKGITRLNETELNLGLAGSKTSWHNQYKDSAWIFMGGLPYDLSEGDVICVFSQYGEIVNANLVRDKATGKFKGYGFLCYENQKSTILAVDNFNGIKLLGRTIRVDHVSDYRKPKDFGDEDEITKNLRDEGCAPKMAPSESEAEEDVYEVPVKKAKKEKKKKKEKKQKKKHKKRKIESSDTDSDSSGEDSRPKSRKPGPPVRVKQEKHDQGYEKYVHGKNTDSKERCNEENIHRKDRDTQGRDNTREIYRDDRKTDREYTYKERDNRKDKSFKYYGERKQGNSPDRHRERSKSVERRKINREKSRSRERSRNREMRDNRHRRSQSIERRERSRSRGRSSSRERRTNRHRRSRSTERREGSRSIERRDKYKDRY